MDKESIYRAAFAASRHYREEISARLGHAHAEAAQSEWNQQRFWLWALERVIEHALAECFWLESGALNYSRAAARRDKFPAIVEELRAARSRLAAGGLPSFAEKERLLSRAADLANTLLD